MTASTVQPITLMRSPCSRYGTRTHPIDLTNDDDIEFKPTKHWEELFGKQMPNEQKLVDHFTGASISGSDNNNPNSKLEEQIKFRINARSVFLTYPKCPIDINDFMSFFLRLKHKIIYACICQEQHKDSSLHVHAVLKFDKKIDIKNQSYFDYNCYHPNIQTTRNINASINYVKKDGNFIEHGALEDHINKECTRMIPEYTEVTYSLLESLLIGYE